MTYARNCFRGLTGSALRLGLVAGLCAMASMPALAQTRASGPIDISADQAEVLRSQCRSIWRGNAEALQDQTRLKARTITAIAQKAGSDNCGQTDRLEAEGDVFFVTPEQTARGNRAVYSARTGMLEVFGDVVVVQGKSVARGEHLLINTRSGAITMDSPAGAGRVRGVFYPDDSEPAR